MKESSETLRIVHLDYSHLGGGLSRMMDRFREEGSMTGDPEADAFLRANPAGALLGLLYDQRVRAEYAFTGPIRLRDRLGHLDLPTIADMDSENLQTLFAEPPAVHRFTNKMANYTRQAARAVTDDWGGDASRIWSDGAPFAEIEKRTRALPGFGALKAAKMKYVLHYFGYRDFSE